MNDWIYSTQHDTLLTLYYYYYNTSTVYMREPLHTVVYSIRESGS